MINIEPDNICQNCNSFFGDIRDTETGLGICLSDEIFDSFIDDIMESSDFTCCYDLYLEKRFNGERAACAHFEESEIYEISNEDDIYGFILNENLKHQKVDEIIENLYGSSSVKIKEAIKSISAYIALGNDNAFEGLLNYYMGLSQADSLEDVHRRIEIVKALSRKKSEKNTINAYVNELARTPSNNTTRQLYSEILKLLGKCPAEMIKEPLLELLDKRQYSYKIKNRIMEIAGI